MKLGTLRAEILEIKDEVVKDEVAEDKVAKDEVDEMMLKTTWIRPGYRIGVPVVKKGAEEIGQSQKWNA